MITFRSFVFLFFFFNQKTHKPKGEIERAGQRKVTTICYKLLTKERFFSNKIENTFLIFFSILQSIFKQ